MALRTPPSWLQYGSHTAENDRLTAQALYSSTGVIGGGMAVTAQGSPNMTVNAGSGWCSIVSSYSNAGVYVGYNDAAVTLTIATQDATNNRIDLIVATVNDQAYSGVTNNITFQVITGTPAVSPTVPSTPSNSIALAQVLVLSTVNSGGQITSGNITDVRVPAISNIVQNPVQSIRLTTPGSAISTGVPFGATVRPQIVAGRNYLLDITLPFTKTTAGTVTWQLVTTLGSNTNITASFSDSLNQSVSVITTTAGTATFAASASYSTATNYVTRFTGTITAGTTGRVYLNLNAVSAGTITPLAGSQFTLTDLGTSATIGNLA
jgi:hypothetical protein